MIKHGAYTFREKCACKMDWNMNMEQPCLIYYCTLKLKINEIKLKINVWKK